jgi:hypothetical protein
MKKIKIINKSIWTTQSLSRFFSAIRRWDIKANDKTEWTIGRSVEVDNWGDNRSCSVSGSAYLNSGIIKMRIGKDIESEQIASVFLHELHHNRGYRHKDMRGNPYQEWAKEIELPLLEIRVEKPRAEIDIAVKRYLLAQKNMDKAETRLKRAKTLFRKWTQKVHYYELKFANKK